jgi:hypothetical protein
MNPNLFIDYTMHYDLHTQAHKTNIFLKGTHLRTQVHKANIFLKETIYTEVFHLYNKKTISLSPDHLLHL